MRSWRIALLAALSLLLAACGHRPAPAPAAPQPQLALPSCYQQLDQYGIGYQRVPDFHTPEGCGIDEAVRVTKSAIPWNRESLASCPFALTEWDFETHVVQPSAQKFLKHRVVRLDHAGTYDCRDERGSAHPERLSQHAFGKAIDLLGFALDDGTVISVRRDWNDKGAKGQFLREVARGACELFAVVITPKSNAFHADHIHMDTGPFKYCGA